MSEEAEPLYQAIGRVTNRTTNTERTISIFEKPTYVAILPIIFLFFFGIFGIAPLSEQVLIKAVCDQMDSNDCDCTEVSARAASLNFGAGLALNIPAVFLCGVFGSLADKYGRKFVIYVTLAGFLTYLAIVFYVATFKPAIYAILFIGANFIFGLTGGYITFIMAALCYVSDCTIVVPHTRHTAYSVTEATIFAPQVIAPVLSGMWAAVYGFSLPYVVGMIACVVNIIYLSFLPESLPLDAESREKPLLIDIWQTFRNLSYLFNYQSADGASPLPHVAGAFLLYFTAAMGFVATRIVYFKHEFHFDSAQIGIYGGMEGLIACLSMLFAPAAYTAVVGHPLATIKWIQVGYFFRALHWTIFSMMRKGNMVFALLPMLLLVGPIAPYCRTIMSNSVPVEEQAKIFSAFSAIEVLGALIGPVYNAIFSPLLRSGIGFVIFDIFAAVSVISFIIITYVRSTPSICNNLPRDHYLQKKEDVRSISTYSATVTIEEIIHDSKVGYINDETEDEERFDIQRRLLSETSECE